MLTAHVATNLYWFGRHLERVESTLKDINRLFDVVIDTDKNAGVAYFEELGTTLSYENASEFLHNAIFGEHDGNLYETMVYARENVIICRSQIDADAFGEVIKLHQHFAQMQNSAHYVDYGFVDMALSLINEIWGALSCGLKYGLSDSFIQLGKLVEKADLNIRHSRDRNQTLSYLDEITYTLEAIDDILDIRFNKKNLNLNLKILNSLIDKIIIN